MYYRSIHFTTCPRACVCVCVAERFMNRRFLLKGNEEVAGYRGVGWEEGRRGCEGGAGRDFALQRDEHSVHIRYDGESQGGATVAQVLG